MDTLDYFEFWEELDSLARDDPEALGERLVRGGEVLTPRLDAPPFTVGDSDDLLLFIFDDGEQHASILRLPPERLTPALREALATLDGRVFAGRADLRPEQWDAVVRVYAALGYPGPEPASLHSWVAQERTRVSAEEIETLWDRWLGGCDVMTPAQMEARPAGWVAFRRAQ